MLIRNFLCLITLIIHELGLRDKENREFTYNHGQKSLGQSKRDFNYMPFTSIVAKKTLLSC